MRSGKGTERKQDRETAKLMRRAEKQRPREERKLLKRGEYHADESNAAVSSR